MPRDCEKLESRRLLAVTLDPASKLLTVTGSNAAESIRLAVSGVSLTVSVNGVNKSFALSKVGKLLINALGGNDNVQIKEAITLPATVNGGSGNDYLRGGSGADVVRGEGGTDTLMGDAGNDSLDGGTGGDIISGGAGIDLADYSLRTNPVTVGIGTLPDDGEAGEHDNVQYTIENVAGGSGADSLTGNGSDNVLTGNAGNDTLIGAGGDDLLDGGDNNDQLQGQNGNDSIRPGAGDDDLTGGAGTDLADYSDHDTPAPLANRSMQITADDSPDDGVYTGFVETEFDNVHSDIENIDGTNGADIVGAFTGVKHELNGRDGDDLIIGGSSGDYIDGGVGNDSIISGMGDDTLIGGPESLDPGQTDQDFLESDEGSDSVVGGADNDTIIGATGDDTAEGGDGNDDISGEVGNDSLSGGPGNDILRGGINNDTLDGGDGVDSLDGGDDNDTLIDPGTIVPGPVIEEISSLASQGDLDDPNQIDTIDAGTGNDKLFGGDGQAFLFGGDGNDTVTGGAGPENIDAGLGDDSVEGGDGNDFINGDFGLDVLNGGAGNDVFVNADGQSDAIDGGDDLDLIQFEPAGSDTATNTEGVYDQPEDGSDLPPNPDSLGAGLQADASASLVSVVSGVLRITGETDAGGAPKDDQISLSQSGATVNVLVNGTNTPVPRAGLKGIFIDAGAGDDFVALATAGGTSTIDLPATMLGGKGDDVLRGGNGNDSMLGGVGNDRLDGNKGNDILNGGLEAAGSDADGRDTFSGGVGEDAVFYTARTTPLFLSLDGVANDGAVGENDSIGSDIEDIFGGRGADSITGNAGTNILAGGTGTDTIRGGAGRDKIVANATKDRGDFVYGDAGQDVLVMGGDNAADRYDIGLDGAFLNRDPAPGGGFLDTPV